MRNLEKIIKDFYTHIDSANPSTEEHRLIFLSQTPIEITCLESFADEEDKDKKEEEEEDVSCNAFKFSPTIKRHYY